MTRRVNILREFDDVVAEIAIARAENKRLRRALALATEDKRAQAEERMDMRTKYGRAYEEHRCEDMPYNWCLRRYGADVGAIHSHNPAYVWEIVRINHCDEWFEDEDEHASAVTTIDAEPSYCPWCGRSLPRRCPEEIRGWSPWEFGFDPLSTAAAESTKEQS